MTETTAQTLQEICRLYDEGLYLQAYQHGETLGPLPQWRPVGARVLAGRLATNLGAPRLGRVLHRLAWRADPSNPEACYFNAFALFYHRGPFAAWKFVQQVEPKGATERSQADWLAFQAMVYATLRDFENADRLIDEARRLAPQRAWIHVERSAVFECDDRYEEALQAAEHALSLRPWYRPAVQATARALVHLNKNEDALALLTEAATRLESGNVVVQLAALQTEAERFEEARANYDRLETLFPLMDHDKDARQWLRAVQADAAYYCGDDEEAARLARLADKEFYTQFAERLEQPHDDGRRVMLPVGFVRQHHQTCAPATLAAISGYWNRPVDQLEVVEKICYDGTPGHSERQWAEENGYTAREFRVTWESAVALIDRGIPFTLATVDPGAAHLQAVIGYDVRRHSLLVRDPSSFQSGEFRAKEMLEHYKATGPRGMAMAPRDRADPLLELDLPDADLYDLYYRLEKALEKHDRQQASSLHEQMQQADPEHRLTVHARGALAGYDSDPRTMLACCRRQLKKFPYDASLTLAQIGFLRELGRRDDRLQLLKDCCEKKDANPLFWIHYAHELNEDARRTEEVTYWTRKAMRYRPVDPQTLGLLADTLWGQQRRGEALPVYRFAACLDDKNEERAKSFLWAARALGRTDEAIQLLTDRFRRAGGRSSLPLRTLSWAYEQLDQIDKSVNLIEEALTQHGDDGEFLLFAADALSRYTNLERAEELLQQARDCAHRVQWLRTAAYMALYRGDYQTGLQRWREIHQAEPLAQDANSVLTQLLADLEGYDEAVAFARKAVERFPHSYGLQVMLIEWLREDDPAVEEVAVRELIKMFPADPWARRELALNLDAQGRCEEAAEETDLASQLEPGSPVADFIHGKLAAARGDVAAAKEAFRESIRKSVDYGGSISALMQVCDTKAEREVELRFVHQQLVEQVIHGDGLLSYRTYASTTFDPEQLLQTLREAFDARPDLWAAWAALIKQLTEMRRMDEALDVAQRAVERFSLVPRMWLELAFVHRAADDAENERESLTKALAINPSWSDAARELADVHNRLGQWNEARGVLERAVALDPREARNHGYLADVLWQLDQREKAIEQIETAVRLAPAYDWAWNALRHWTRETGREGRVVELAEAACKMRPHDVATWMVLAESLDQPDQVDQRLAALDRALRINPRDSEIHSMRAYYLGEAGRFDEAIAACRPDVFEGKTPIDLRGRAAELEAMRGDMESALRQMHQVVEDDPDYFWAWSTLATWYEPTEEHDHYRQAAEQMARIAPHHPPSWGHLGDAKLRMEDRTGAKEDFRRSAQLAPDYLFGVMTLFRLHLEDGELDQATEIAALAAPHVDDDLRLSMQVRLAARRRSHNIAQDQLRQLCACPMENDIALAAAVGEMDDMGMHETIAATLIEHIRGQRPHPVVGTVWVDYHAHRRTLKRCADELARGSFDEEFWVRTSERLVDQFGCARRPEPFAGFLRRTRKRLLKDNRAWAAVAHAMLEFQQYNEIIQWQQDWRSRSVEQCGVVFPLVVALWRRRRVAEAVELGQQALEMTPDGTRDLHRVWLATAAVMDARADEAATLMDGIRPEDFDRYYKGLARLVIETTQLFRAAANRESRMSFRAARDRMFKAFYRNHNVMREDALAKWIYRRCRWRLAKLYHRPLAAALIQLIGAW